MKFYCVLLSFVFVHILAVSIDDCKKAGLITNDLLRQISTDDDFRSLIKELIIHEKYSMEKLAFMFAAPELATPESLRILKSYNYGREWQTEILWAIKTLRVPDASAKKCIKYEQDIQREILGAVSSIRMPDTQRLTLEMEVDTITDVGFARRAITKHNLRRLIMAVNYQDDTDFNPLQLCHLIGMYKNSLFLSTPLAFIKTAKINKLGRCKLTFANGSSIYCERFQNALSQIWKDNNNKTPILSWSEIVC